LLILLCRGGDARPFVHPDARDELVAANLRTEEQSLPSFTSDQSLPKAATTFGWCVIRIVFVPGAGGVASILRRAAARAAFSSRDTTRPTSVRSAVFSMSLKPASSAVS
jgi:hypothetical protein